MESLILSDIIIYPLKSAAGIHLRSARITERGFLFDRHWMVVDEAGMFVTQRQVPHLALVTPSLTEEHLVLNAPGVPLLHLPLEPANQAAIPVRIWSDTCVAVSAGVGADEWMSDVLGFHCRLVRQGADDKRQVDLTYARQGDQVGFADGFPFLLVSEASLADLNARLSLPLSMNRFRPNLVVAGCAPYAEDSWLEIRIGKVTFRVVKPCARCSITTVDQATGKTGKEPLQTLAEYRRVGNKVIFGQNLTHAARGTPSVGNAIEVLARIS